MSSNCYNFRPFPGFISSLFQKYYIKYKVFLLVQMYLSIYVSLEASLIQSIILQILKVKSLRKTFNVEWKFCLGSFPKFAQDNWTNHRWLDYGFQLLVWWWPEQWIRPVEQMRDQMVATQTVMGLPRCVVISDI